MDSSQPNSNLAYALDTVALVNLEQDGNLPEGTTKECTHFLSERCTDPRQELVAQLKSCWANTPARFRFSIQVINACFFVDLLFQSLDKKFSSNNRLFTGLLSIKISLLKTILFDPRFLESKSHYFRSILNQIVNLLSGWSDDLFDLHPSCWTRVATLLDLLSRMNGDELDAPDSLHMELNNLAQLKQQFSESSATLRRQELKRHEQNAAQREVDDFLDKVIANKLFPALIVRFIKETWRPTLLRHKKDDSISVYAWQQICQFTEDFCQTFCLDKNPKSDLLIATIKPNLSKYIIGSEKDKLPLITEIIKTLAKIQKGDDVKSVVMQPFLERNRFKHINFTSAIIKTVSALNLDQWIEFKGGEYAGKTLQLCAKLAPSQEVLLINATGDSAVFMSLQGLAYLITSKQTQFLSTENSFESALADASATFSERLAQGEALKLAREQEHIKALTQALADADEDTKKLNKQLTECRLKFESTVNFKNQEIAILAKSLSTTQAELREQEANIIKLKQQHTELEIQYLQKIEALQESKSRVETENKAALTRLLEDKKILAEQLQQKNQENRRHHIIQMVKSLTIGSWLEIVDEQQRYTPCKIAMIYASSGKYVLVDGKGLALGEYIAEDLIELFEQDRARIVQQAGNFDDSMQSIIKSLK